MPTIAVGADHAGVQLKAELLSKLTEWGHRVEDVGTHDTTSVDYPDFAAKVTEAVNSKRADLGLLVCGTGMGMSIAANKVHGIRAALCRTEFEARLSRQHNDANVLCLGQRVTGGGLAIEILKVFLAANFEGGRHAVRVQKMSSLEAKR